MSNGPIVPFEGSPIVFGTRSSSPSSAHVPNPLPAVIFTVLQIPWVVWMLVGGVAPPVITAAVLSAIGGGIIASMVRIAAQWERALIFRLGRFQSLRGPGPFFLVPFFDSAKLVDTRIQTLDIPRRQAITKDNVPVSLDGVIFMRVSDPGQAVTRVRHYEHAIQQYAQTALRDIVGSMTLDELLADRELVGERIAKMVEVEIDGWGIDLAAIRIQDIEMPEDLKRVMARQASAEREKRATITKAEGDRDAAHNLADAAARMAASPGALQLRTLQTIDGLGNSPANTVILAIPIEVVEALRSVPQLADKLGKPKPAAPEEERG